MRRGWCFLLSLLACTAPPASAEEGPLPRYDRVEVKAAWTSIYIGTVSLKMPALTRGAAGDFETTYAARVFPYFFHNETGRLSIHVSGAALQQQARGEVFEFSGRAVNQAGEERRVEGKATPSDATHGKIKVKVRVSARVELIFNTTYAFAP